MTEVASGRPPLKDGVYALLIVRHGGMLKQTGSQ